MNKKISLMRPFIGEEELQSIKEVLDSGYLTEGPKTQEFERAFARYVSAKHAVATTSCTTALELSLRVLGVGAGDEVIVPDFTYPITGGVASIVGAKPVLVDVEMDSYNIDPNAVEKAITEKTKCVIPVSIFGNPVDMKPVYELQSEYNFYIVEDAACSAGAEIDGKKVGTLADLSCFSFHPRKVITTGEGGMITTGNDEWAGKIRSLKRFGIEDGKFADIRGTNYKLSDVLGVIGLMQLKKIDAILEYRIKQAKLYNELLEDVEYIQTPIVMPKVKHIYQTYVVYIKKSGLRDKLRQELLKKGIETQIGTYALHLEPCFKEVKMVGSLENSEKLYKNLLALPMYQGLSYEDQKYVCDSISEILGELI